ncbi:hypothetical protein EV421DRAFT_1914031 [Armillaria borealis]|uniref:Uncharacterized protein n=1 Tax=Armillaria borealis TaxID=47425 RepID=A0AA39MDL1_9AGAR|nr:hypothetical protein EV421DRAFT_1914031 [Armillaria borealis]
MDGRTSSEAVPTSSSNLLPEPPSKSLVTDSQSSSEDSDDTSGDSDMAAVHQVNLITCFQDITFRRVTISAFTETGQAESSIEVPLQWSYMGRCPVIPSSLADTPCATLGVQGVLDRLNETLRMSYTLNTPSLLSILEDCIKKNYDFGTAYGHLRRIWYTAGCSDI